MENGEPFEKVSNWRKKIALLKERIPFTDRCQSEIEELERLIALEESGHPKYKTIKMT